MWSVECEVRSVKCKVWLCSFPDGHTNARGKPQTLDKTCWSFKTSISCETSSNFDKLQLKNRRFPTSCSEEAENLIAQNRCFVRGFRQISSHLTKYHTCQAICTLSPLCAALPMRFAKRRNTTRLKCCAGHET